MKAGAAGGLALLLAAACPAVAQMPAPVDESAEAAARPRGNPMFAGMSDVGRMAMRTALRAADQPAARVATDAARDRWLALLEADRLDPAALKRAMDDEREAATAAKVRHQAALIAGFQQLSIADRRAFVANARAMRSRIDSRTAAVRSSARLALPR